MRCANGDPKGSPFVFVRPRDIVSRTLGRDGMTAAERRMGAWRAAAIGILALLAACTNAPSQPDTGKPGAGKGEAMVAAADPLAVEAGLEMLRAGGSAL